jgi:hypothetical protein
VESNHIDALQVVLRDDVIQQCRIKQVANESTSFIRHDTTTTITREPSKGNDDKESSSRSVSQSSLLSTPNQLNHDDDNPLLGWAVDVEKGKKF